MKYEIPALTDEQREELIQYHIVEIDRLNRVLPQWEEFEPDHEIRSKLTFELLTSQIVLASLMADPVGTASADGIEDLISGDRSLTRVWPASADWVRVGKSYFIYTAPPVPTLKLPGEWSERIYDSFDCGYDGGWTDCLAEVKRLNGIE